MLLYYAEKYPDIKATTDIQVNTFIDDEYSRQKNKTPDLGMLLVALTLSDKGWTDMWKPFLLETFDRNVRWLFQKTPELARMDLDSESRLRKTLDGARTSLRLFMFQVHFLSQIRRPAEPAVVLQRYHQRLGTSHDGAKGRIARSPVQGNLGCHHVGGFL